MNLRLIFVQSIYRVIFGAGIAALMWVGGQLIYAKTFQLYAMSRLNNPLMRVASSPLQSGDLMGRLDIPERGISVVVLEGVEEDTLGIAAGHVPGTPLPGSDGNFAIAAHRDTYFRGLRHIRVGDTIRFSTSEGTFGYLVTTTEIVDPSETRVLESRGRAELTLITCYPFSFVGDAPQRFIVHARPQVNAKNVKN